MKIIILIFPFVEFCVASRFHKFILVEGYDGGLFVGCTT